MARPPAVTSLQRLPFGELTWENFERLCYRLAGLTDGVEFHSRYGRGGQAQQGIDVYVRLAGGRYEVWQVKSCTPCSTWSPPCTGCRSLPTASGRATGRRSALVFTGTFTRPLPRPGEQGSRSKSLPGRGRVSIGTS